MRLDTLRKIRMKIKSGALREFCHEAKWVWRYIRRYRLAVGIYILLGLLSTLMGLGTSVASKYLIDAVTGYKTGAIGTAAAAMAGMMVLSIVLRSISSLVGAKNSVFIHNEIQAEVYEAVLHTAWEPLEDYRPGDLLSRLTSDVDTVSASVTSFAPGLISGLAQFFGALIIMFYFDPTMALMREHNRQMKAISSDVMSFYEDSLTNITSIKAFDITGLFSHKMRRLQRRYQTEYLDYNRFSVRTSVFLSLVGTAVSAGCFGWGVYRLWSGAITYGSLTMFLQLASSLSSSFSALIGLVSSAISISTSAGRIMAVVHLPEEDCEEALPMEELSHAAISIDHGAFSYQNGEPVLTDACFYAEPGELVALTGPSGEGKTTMLRLLLGLIRPQTGTADLICGDTRYPLSAKTRGAFAYVPQGNSMFAGTIRENLLLTNPQAGEGQLEQVLRTACAYDFVMELPGRLDYAVGGHGKGLSEGQAQRLAIARALLRGAPILLLDEATSALDEETEHQLLQNLMDSGLVHTCIFVTHRPAATTICHRRYRVAEGTVREEAPCSE